MTKETRLMRCYEIAVDKCLEQDVPIVEPKKVQINNRYKTRWGACKGKWIGGKFVPSVIDINPILLDEQNSETGIIETLIHELIHTCPGCQNHGAKWKSYANKVAKAYGYTINTRNTVEEKSMSDECAEIFKTNYISRRKYELSCQKCGKVVGRWARPSKIWLHSENYRCAFCKGKLIHTGEMQLLKPVWN